MVQRERVARGRGTWGALVAVAGLVSLAAGCGGCREEAPEFHLSPRTGVPGIDEPVRAGPTLEGATDVAAGRDREGRVVAVVRDESGALVFHHHRGHGWISEAILEGALDGPASVDHLETGETLVTVVMKPGAGGAPPVSAYPGAPEAAVPSEGEVVLAKRRSPNLWRVRRIAARALLPKVAAGRGEEVHLVFLQPAPDGFAVVYVRTDGVVTLREEVAARAHPVAPDLVLVDGLPLVTWVGDDDGPVVLQARGSESGVFGTPSALPAEILGLPRALPQAVSWLPDEAGGWLGLVRPVGEEGLSLDGKAAALHPRAGAALLLARLSVDAAPTVRLLATADAWEGPAQVAMAWPLAATESTDAARGDEMTGDEAETSPEPAASPIVAAIVGGVPVLFDADGTPKVDAPGRGRAAGLGASRAVFATGDRLWTVPLAAP